MFRALLIVLAAAGLLALVTYYNKKQSARSERYTELPGHVPANHPVHAEQPSNFEHFTEAGAAAAAAAGDGAAVGIKPAEGLQQETYKPVDFATGTQGGSTGCFPKDRLTAEDLLPKDAANERWAAVNPAGQGGVDDSSYLSSGFHVGLNTVGSAKRNGNLQLRSEPPNPRIGTGPWLQSTRS